MFKFLTIFRNQQQLMELLNARAVPSPVSSATVLQKPIVMCLLSQPQLTSNRVNWFSPKNWPMLMLQTPTRVSRVRGQEPHTESHLTQFNSHHPRKQNWLLPVKQPLTSTVGLQLSSRKIETPKVMSAEHLKAVKYFIYH